MPAPTMAVEQNAVAEHERHLPAHHRARLPLVGLVPATRDGERAAAVHEHVEQSAGEEEEADVHGDDERDDGQRRHPAGTSFGS